MAFTPVATTDTLETFRTRYNATNITLVDDSSTTVDITLATDSLKLSGGTGIASAISGDVVTFNLSNSGVSAATYGSSTAIPVLAVNAQGQITGASTASISTDLTLVDDASTSATISLATDTLKISGGTGTTSAISGDTLTINLDNTAVSAGSVGSSTAIPVLTIDAQGRITAASTASVSSDLTLVDDSSTSETITLGSETLKFAGGTGISTAITSGTVTISKSAGTASRLLFKFTATSGQTTFSGADASSNTLAYVTGSFDVFLNGVLLDATDFTASNGTSVVLASAAAADDILTVLAYETDNLSTFDTNGSELILDADGDTSITADVDDQIDIKIGGSDIYTLTATTFDFNGQELILDADADTSIHASSDDQIDFKLGGTDLATLTDGQLSLTSATASRPGILLESTNADANPPFLRFQKNGSSPANNDEVGVIQFYADDDGGNVFVPAQIKVTTPDVANGSEDGQISFFITKAGADTEQVRMESDGDLHVDGDVIGFSTTVSDVALKSDIEVIPNALDKIDEIQGYTFTRHNGKKSAGIIAQELEKVLPEAVNEKTLALIDGKKYKSVEYDAIHGLLIQAIKELKNEIRELKS